MWSTVAARDIGLIGKREARQRVALTLEVVAKLERNEAAGMFYNWYDPATGEKLYTFPESGDPIKPFLSVGRQRLARHRAAARRASDPGSWPTRPTRSAGT